MLQIVYTSLYEWEMEVKLGWLSFSLQKKKGTEGIIEIANPNLVKPKNMKARDIDVSWH